MPEITVFPVHFQDVNWPALMPVREDGYVKRPGAIESTPDRPYDDRALHAMATTADGQPLAVGSLISWQAGYPLPVQENWPRSPPFKDWRIAVELYGFTCMRSAAKRVGLPAVGLTLVRILGVLLKGAVENGHDVRVLVAEFEKEVGVLYRRYCHIEFKPFSPKATCLRETVRDGEHLSKVLIPSWIGMPELTAELAACPDPRFYGAFMEEFVPSQQFAVF